MFAFVAAAIFSSEPTPPPSFAAQCAGSFMAAGLNFAQFELYDRWFDDNSSLTLAQAGTYNGATDIVCATDYASNRGLIAACRQEFATHVFEPRLGQEEYVRFLSPNSPYISTLGGFDLERSLLSVDAEKKTCVFIQRFHDRLQVTTRGPALSDPKPPL